MRTTSPSWTPIRLSIAGLALAALSWAAGGPASLRAHEEDHPKAEAAPAVAPAEAAKAAERWKAFREHVEKQGKKDLLPAEEEGASKTPSADAIIGVLFRMSPELAAADAFLEEEPVDIAAARARLAKLDARLESSPDPYLGDYAALLRARCDLADGHHREAARGFIKVVGSERNLATSEAHRGLAQCYRGLDETTLEVLELRFLLSGLAPDRTADRSWAESRLAEIRRDHPGPLKDSARRMEELTTRLTALEKQSQGGQAIEGKGVEEVSGDQKKVEEILIKVAKLLDDAANKCPMCSSSSCQACKKCGACTATGMCPDGQHAGLVSAEGQGRKPGQGEGDPKDKSGKPAQRSKANQKDSGEHKLRDPAAKDGDAWGSANEREVAKALQDLWGKIPPGYRQVVAQYFKDISGLENESAPAGEKK